MTTNKMKTTPQGPEFGREKKRVEFTVVNIQEVSFDGEFVQLVGDPVGLAIRQEQFAEWLMLKHYSAYIAGLTEGKGRVFDWYFGTFEDHFTTKRIEAFLKSYIESQTTFLINYD